ESIGRTVALDGNSVQTQEHRAVVAARIAAQSKFSERASRKKIANARQQRVTKSRLEEVAKELCGTLCRLDRNVAGKAIGDDDVNRPRCDIVAFDKPVEVNGCHRRPQPSTGLTNGVVSLQIFRTDIEEADGGFDKTEDGSREDVAHHGELH